MAGVPRPVLRRSREGPAVLERVLHEDVVPEFYGHTMDSAAAIDLHPPLKALLQRSKSVLSTSTLELFRVQGAATRARAELRGPNHRPLAPAGSRHRPRRRWRGEGALDEQPLPPAPRPAPGRANAPSTPRHERGGRGH